MPAIATSPASMPTSISAALPTAPSGSPEKQRTHKI
jgi:hypothetical protein